MSDKKETIISAGDIPAMLMRLPKGMYKLEITAVDRETEEPKPSVSQEPKYYIELLAQQLKLYFRDTIATCKRIHNATPGALLSMLLMTIAKEMDLNYPKHISECSEVYVYSTVNSKIGVIDTKNVNKASFKYFAAFRSKEDVVLAIKLANAIKNFINEY